MKTATPTTFRQARAPKAGNVIEPVITYEELPIVTEAAREELLASLQQGEDDLKAGRGKQMSADEVKAELRTSFEKITGYKVV
ncbi:MAG: hypothetical protein P4L81_06195 [Candidatus Pacebacteria bacterium]|nr:hypothetical protein [Candidatus Paceibacterota bacterium]